MMKPRLVITVVLLNLSLGFAQEHNQQPHPIPPIPADCNCPARLRAPIPPNLSCDDLNFLWRSGFELSGEALLLTASNKAADFAVNATNDPTASTTAGPIDGELVGVRPGYKWGFRINATGTIPRDRWRISASFVGWEGKEAKSNDFQFIYGTFFNPGPETSEAEKSTASLSNRLYFLDLGLSRILPLTRALLIEPGLFVRFLKFNQLLKVNYSNIVADQTGNQVLAADIKHRYRSLGPRFGLNLFWQIWSGFFLTGKVGIIPLYGETSISASTLNLSTGQATDPQVSAKGKSWSGESMIETGIGLLWRRFFSSVPLGIEVSFSWEQWQTSSFGDVLFFTNAPTTGSFQLKRGDICFQGIAFGTGLQF
ncbi:MAG: Lpg1974 family pore-forming outer membrane protein [Chlamydiota bacterium]